MKILVVSPYPVLPLTHGGRVRTYRLATALAGAGAAVDVLCPWGPGEPWRRFRREGVTFQPHFFAANVLPFILRDRFAPSLIALSAQPFGLGPRRRLRAVDAYDVIQFEFCAYPAWMERIRADTRIAYSAHNVEYDFWRGRTSPRVRPRLLERMAALEQRSVHASDLVVATTETDATRLRDLYGGRAGFAVIPNGFDESLLHLDRESVRPRARAKLGIAPDETVLVFVGGPAAHNREAVAFLERELVPGLGRQTSLLLVGESAFPAGTRRRGAAVRRLRYAPDLSAVLAAADVALNPVSSGSGSNLKLGEYLAAGLPVVTTPVGLRGFEPLRGWLTVAELDEFAAAVRDPKRVPPSVRSELGDWTWSSLGRRLRGSYEQLVGGSVERRP